MIENIIEQTGSFGRFQWMLLFVAGGFLGPTGVSMFMMTFGGVVPDWWCLTDEEKNLTSTTNMSYPTESYKNCSRVTTESCSRVYEEYTSTIVSEFDLVCGNAWIVPTVTSIQMGGVLVGSFFGGQSADMFGRKKTLFIAQALLFIFNLAAACSTSWEMFAAFRFLIGVSIGCYMVVSAYILEFIGRKRRAFANVIPFWAVGICLFALAAYLLHDWRHLHMLWGLVIFPMLFGYFLAPESARWLATKGRVDEAMKIFQRIARMNGRPVPDDAQGILKQVAEMEYGGKKYTYLDLGRSCQLAKLTSLVIVAWMCTSAVYYGFAFGLSRLSGNFYLNLFIMNVIEFPLGITLFFVLNKFGRRYTGAITVLVSAALCISILVVQEVTDVRRSNAITGLALTARLLITASWAALILLTNESYPTVIRNLSMGAGNTAARLGGIVSPYIFNVNRERETPYIIMTTLMIVSGIAILLIKDTKDMPLQDVISGEKGAVGGAKENNKPESDTNDTKQAVTSKDVFVNGETVDEKDVGLKVTQM